MTRTATRTALGTLAGLALGSAAHAHHSYAQYDRCEAVTIEGKIERIEWTNPHIILSVKTDETIYRVEWFTMLQLAQAGLDERALKSSDEVVITGSKNRNPELNVMTLLTAISRPSDGWSWSRPRADVCRDAK
jgi:Family of unknown function (DUF6152)